MRKTKKKSEPRKNSTGLEKHSTLPDGWPSHYPAELLSSTVMSNYLEEFTERYKDLFITIESPPPQLTADTSAIVWQVEGIILVKNYDSTPHELVEYLVEILYREKILGFLLKGSGRKVVTNHEVRAVSRRTLYPDLHPAPFA